MTVCEAPKGDRLAWRRTDGTWERVPCDPSTPYVCWYHKVNHLEGQIKAGRDHQLKGGRAFLEANKGGYTQRELMMDSINAAREGGYELQRKR